MGAHQQPAALLLLGLCLLYLAPTSIDAACCTFGQPKYIDAEIVTPWLTVATCSDGPCKGPGYDYLVAGGVQSPQVDSCCDTAPGDPVNGFFYNPQQGATYPNGSLALWYPNPFQPFPGTGKTCNRNQPFYQCTIGGEQVPTCQDVNVTAPGAQPYVCPPYWVFDNESDSLTLRPEDCCNPLRPKLALISSFPASYNGATANLRADQSEDKDVCIKAPSPRLNVSGVTVLQPGAGQCAGNNSGFMVPGSYELDEGVPPPGTEFLRWECYNITDGTQGPPIPIPDLSVPLFDNSSVTCVAVFDVLALPAAKLALISQFPPEYTGPTANLSAVAGAINAVCVKPFSPRLGQGNVTIAQPGPGFCGNNSDGVMPPGTYVLAQSAPKGTIFDRWDCFDISSGSATNPQDVDDITLENSDAVTCVAVYNLIIQPKLALISQFPDSYNGPTANLTAVSLNVDNCTKAPSPRLGQNGVTVLQPGLGKCNVDGDMQPGTYQLGEAPPSGTSFVRWECFDISSGTAQGPASGTTVVLSGSMEVTCVAVYSLIPSPSPAPRLPSLALISQFPAGYNGPTANLSAVRNSSGPGSCVEAPSSRLGTDGVTVTAPGPGLCNGNGTMPVGDYNLIESAPPGTEFDRWDCYNVVTGGPPSQDVDGVDLGEGDVITCVAVYVLKPKLALISEFPFSYNGPTGNLTATAVSDKCEKAPSPRLDQNGVTVLQPGAGQCGADGYVDQGVYTLTQTAPPGTTFNTWRCFDITTGNGVPLAPSTTVTLTGATSVSCVAVYSPIPSPSPPPALPSPSPAPQPKLALISEFPAGYNGTSANLTAISTGNVACVEAPSSILGRNGVSIKDPGPGFCGTDGSMPASNYSLNQNGPPGTEFEGWECYEITDDTPRPVPVPSGSNVQLNTNEMVTCVAVYVYVSSPSPAPLPKLALVSNFPPGYEGPSSNLTATGRQADCVKAPSPVLGTDNVSVVAPGEGLCGVDGSIPSGPYNLTQVAPPGVRLDFWECFEIEGNTSVSLGKFPVVLLEGSGATTCVANYVLAEGTCADALPAVPGAQPYNCSRASMALNSSAAMMGPASDDVCCMATCSDRNVTSPTAQQWSCPVNSTFDTTMVMGSPPTDDLCCIAGPPFTVDKSGPSSVVKPGDAFSYTIAVGFTEATTGVTVTDDLPAGLLPSSTAATWTATSSVAGNPASGVCVTAAPASPEFVCNLGTNVTWAKGDTVSVIVPVVVAAGTQSGTLVNVANVVDLNNNTAQDAAEIDICAECALPTNCFDAIKTGPTTVQAGSSFDFKIAVLFSCKPAGPVTVTDTLPDGLQATGAPATWKATYVNASTLTGACTTTDNSFSCSLGAAWGPSDKVEITVPVAASASAQGTLVNQAIVTDGNRTVTPEAPVNVTKPDPTGPPFVVSKTGPTTVKAGEAFDYNLIVTFFGASTGVVVVDDLPPQMTSTSKPGSWKSVTVNGQNPSGDCSASQVDPGGSGSTLRTRITCNLGSNYTWAVADRVEITLPVIAGASAAGETINIAIATDDKNRTAQDDHPVIIAPVVPEGLPFTITKTGPTQPVLAGQPFSYSIVVGFLETTKGVKVTDILPASVLPGTTPATWFTSKTNTTGACVTNTAATPNTITCDLGATTVWSSGDIVEITVPVVAGLAAATNAINTAVITDDLNRTSQDTFPVTINVDPMAPFSLTKTGPQKVTQGQPFLFEVNVVFLGTAKGVSIIDEMPPGLWPTGNATWTATSANNVPGGTCTTTNRTGTTGDASYSCDLGAAVTWSRGDRIRMLVPSVATTALQQLTNRATVRDDLNRTATGTAAVSADLPAPPNALMNIIKSGPTTPVAVGQPFVFTIAARFNAAGPFTAARIVDDLPTGLLPNGTATWVGQNAAAGRLTGNCVTTPAASPEFTCDLGAATVWAGGDSVDVTVPVVAGPTAATNVVNRATIAAVYNGQTVTLDDTAAVNITVPTLKVTKLGPGLDVQAGQTFPFTITAGVAGEETVNPLIIVDELQSTDLKFVAPMPPNCVQNTDQRATCTWNEPVGPGDEKLVQFRVTASTSGTFQNRATVLTTMPGVANQTATAPVTVVPPTVGPIDPPSIISVDKKGPSQAIEANQEFTFTLTASVQSGNVSTMVLTDAIEASTGITFVRVAPATGCTVAAQLLRCNLTAPFPQTLTLTAKGSKAGTFTNRVELRSPDATAIDEADVTIVTPDVETCTTWVQKNGCGAGQVLNDKNAGRVLNDTSNTAAVKIICCATAPPQSVPDVRLTKAVSKAINKEGGKFNYTFNVNNLGSLEPDNEGTAFNVIVADNFPVGVAPTSNYWIEPPGLTNVCSFTGTNLRTMRCSLGSMMSRDTKKITVEVLADGLNFVGKSALQETLNNTATLSCANSATSRTQDPTCEKNSRANTTVVKVANPQGNLNIVKSAEPRSGDSGTVFTFTIVLDPELGVNNVVLTDRIPPQLTNAKLLTTFGGDCAITTAAKRSTRQQRGLLQTLASVTRSNTRSNTRNNRRNNNNNNNPLGGASNPLGSIIDAVRGGGGGGSDSGGNGGSGGGPVTPAAQQTLRCTFDTLSSKREIRYTAVGNVVGTWTNVATVTHTGGQPKNSSVPVTVNQPQRPVTGSCCYNNWRCSSNVAQDACDGTWSSSNTACSSKMFCSGACCRGGGTTAASCSITKKDQCEGSLFSSNQWSADGDCNSGFCPKPTQCMSKCQPCDASRPCCSGLSCLPSGNGWSTSGYVCQATSYYSSWRKAATASASGAATAAAAAAAQPAIPASAKVFATPTNVKNEFCSAIGELCGTHDEGRQCCGPKVDCIVVGGLTPRCKSRDTCKPAGSKCEGVGECCSGHVCSENRCKRAECPAESSCQTRDYTCKYWRQLNCEAFYAAATSSPDR